MRLLLLSFLLLVTACVDENLSPEGALREFVESRMGSTVTRQFVMDRVTGKLKVGLENMSDEDFEKFADLRNVRKDSFKVLAKSCQENKCFLTYSVSYRTTLEKMNFSSEVKKIAELLLFEKKWLIADVSNIKTYHESLEAINPLE